MMTKTLQDEIKRSRPFECLEEEVALNLARTQAHLAEPVYKLLKQEKLSGPLHNILRILLGAEPDGLPSLEIADRMVTRVPDITRLVDRLEQANLVKRERSTEDRRVVRVRITPEGKEKVESLKPKLLDLHRDQFTSLNRKELQELNRLLVKARR
ncbi:MAG: MarR family transcriptional regulator [Candidatus Omnitrophica bacterium]|nr:MarR family transcriptional regulator [Candidatus Omnitrophota bacterium]MCB9781758.1 MarR family transcriptional regulator [Candidatus Omnitrophota bacterium]